MKIYRIAFPLPLDTLAIEEGENKVDSLLSEKDIQRLDSIYHFKNHLGGGAFGIAFSTFDGKVVKITTDRQEYISALDLIGDNWQKYAPFVKFYKAFQLHKGVEVFVIVKDMVTPLTEEEKNLFYTFTDEFNSEIDNVTEEFKNKMDLFNEFEGYINDVQNYTQYADTMNVDNIGRNSEGTLVAFDPRKSNSMWA
jgi:hypothetical protein